MRIMRIGAALAALFLAAACKPSGILYYDQPIEGPYRLRAIAGAANMHICYERRGGNCDLRIPGRVFAIAYDEDFIVAAVHPQGEEASTQFYYAVRDFDGPGADLNRVVRGPYDHDAFVAQMRAHGVPAPALVVPPR